jgi:hypothetical protein
MQAEMGKSSLTILASGRPLRTRKDRLVTSLNDVDVFPNLHPSHCSIANAFPYAFERTEHGSVSGGILVLSR